MTTIPVCPSARADTLSGMVEDLYYRAAHYNLKYKTGTLLNRITARVCAVFDLKTSNEFGSWDKTGTPRLMRFGELCRGAPKRQ
jgi:hypothetical protein